MAVTLHSSLFPKVISFQTVDRVQYKLFERTHVNFPSLKRVTFFTVLDKKGTIPQIFSFRKEISLLHLD